MPGASHLQVRGRSERPRPSQANRSISMLKRVQSLASKRSDFAADLHLASHVRACEVDGQVILLDLLRGRYLGVGPSQAQALAEVVAGWPLASRSGSAAEGPLGVSRLTTRLVAEGVLSVRQRDVPKEVSVQSPTSTFDAASPGRSVPITMPRLTRFLRAASSAYVCLRFRSLQSIATMVSSRRERSASRCVADSRALRDAVAVYHRLRPLAFTVRDKCLFDSLALLEFLADEDMHPHWLIGVKTHPFAAHSWVQSGPLVLNDHHEHVRSYRTILAA